MTARAVPAGVKASILRSVARAQHPRTALPEIALQHNLTLDDVRDVVQSHGWPKSDSMLRAAEILDRKATEGVSEGDAATDLRLLTLPADQVIPDPKNVRQDLGDLTELMDSIVAEGLEQPPTCRVIEEQPVLRVMVVTGHRRRAALIKLGWTDLPVLVRSGVNPADVLAKMLIENTQRKDLDPIEEARGLAALKERDSITDADLGRRIGKSQPYVSGRLALLALPDDQQQAVRAGTMPITRATTAGRHRAGTHRPNAQGKESAAHLDLHHPLAAQVEHLCRDVRKHHKNTPGRVGGVGCGRCWEDIIRADERRLQGLEAVRA